MKENIESTKNDIEILKSAQENQPIPFVKKKIICFSLGIITFIAALALFIIALIFFIDSYFFADTNLGLIGFIAFGLYFSTPAILCLIFTTISTKSAIKLLKIVSKILLIINIILIVIMFGIFIFLFIV